MNRTLNIGDDALTDFFFFVFSLAESKPEECKRQFLGALVWARRLGSAAKLGVQVIMRQPDATNILQPTPVSYEKKDDSIFTYF